MSTITLSGNTLSGRLGIGSYYGLGSSFKSARTSTADLSKQLGTLRNKIDAVNTSASVDGSQAENAKTREENKSSALTCGYSKMDLLVSNVGTVDNKTATEVEKLKKDFYKKYDYLKPGKDKNILDWIKDGAGKLWDGLCKLGEAIKKIAIGVGKWLKAHWKELLLGLACIVIGAILTVLTGGAATFLAAFVSGLIKAAVFAAIEGTISGAVTYAGARMSGKSREEAFNVSLNAFGDSFASGFCTAGISFGGSAAGKVIGKTYKWYNRLQKASKGVSYVKKGFDHFETIGDITTFVMPDSDAAKMYNKITSNGIYKYSKKAVKYTSVFLSAAADNAVITDGSYMKDGKKLNNVRYMTKDGRNGAIYETDSNGKAMTEMFYKNSQSQRKHASEDWGIGSGFEKYKMTDQGWKYDSFKSDVYNKNKILEKIGDNIKDAVLGKNKNI